MTNNSSLWDEKDLVGTIGAHEYLGRILAYNLTNLEIDYDWLYQQLSRLNLLQYAPQAPKPADVFRRLTSQISGYYSVRKNERQKVDVIRINEQQNPIERVIMLVEVDQENIEVSDGKKVCRLLFNKETNVFEAEYGPFWHNNERFESCPDYLINLIENAKKEYFLKGNILSPQQIRDMFHTMMIKSGMPAKMGMSSLWNIPATREDIITKIETLANAINEEYNANSVLTYSIPVVNTKEERKKISTNTVIYAMDRLNKLMQEEQIAIATAKNADKQKIKSRERFQAEANELMTLVMEYEQLIGEALDEVRQAKEITLESLETFCNDPVKQAELKTQITENTGGRRRVRMVTLNEKNDIQKPEEEKPLRRFNLVDSSFLNNGTASAVV